MMTGYQLRRHLEAAHDIPTRGLTYEQMAVLHHHDHRPGIDQDHHHDDGPDSTTWGRECAQFGCDDIGAARVAVLEYMVLIAIVLTASWLYWLAGT